MRFTADPNVLAWLADPGGNPLVVNGSFSPRAGGAGSLTTWAKAERIKIRQEVDGDAPDGISHVAGASLWRLDADFDALTANDLHPATVAGRDKLTGFGSLLVAFGGTPVPMFSGSTREIGVDEGGGSITVSMDGPESYTRPDLTLPAMGSYRAAAGGQFIRYPLNATAVVIAALHRMGRRVTPAPRPNCVLSVPGIWGAIPDIGHIAFSGAGAPEGTSLWAPSRWNSVGLECYGGGTNTEVTGWPSRWSRWEQTAAVQWGCDYLWNGASSSVVLDVSLGPGQARIRHSPTAVEVGLRSTMSNPFVWTQFGTSAGAGWRNYTATVQSTTTPGTVNLRIHVDGVQLGSIAVASGSKVVPSESDAGPVYVMAQQMRNRTRIELHHAIGVGALTYPDSSSTMVTQQAILEPSMLTLDTLPAIDGRSPWEVITEIASAELAEASYLEDGRFRYRRRSTVNASTTPLATISTDLATSLGGSASATSVRSKIVGTAHRLRLRESGVGTALRSPSHLHDEPIKIPSGKGSILIDLDREVQVETGIVTPISAAGMASDYPCSWAICVDKQGNTLAPISAVTASLHMIGPRTARIDYANITQPLWAVWPQGWGNPPGMTIRSGDGSFVVLGRHALADTEIPRTRVEVENAGTRSAWGDRSFTLPESPWRQSAAVVRGVASVVLASSTSPRLELEDITIPGDPRYQIGDVVTVTDTRSRWPPFTARVHGITHEISTRAEGRMTTTLTLKAI